MSGKYRQGNQYGNSTLIVVAFILGVTLAACALSPRVWEFLDILSQNIGTIAGG